MKRISLMMLLFVACSVWTSWAADPSENIIVTEPWVRLQPPSRPNSAAFMTIENKSPVDIVLRSAASESIETIELHSMEHVDGIMKMRQVDEIKIPANGKVDLKPGGLHLMLFGIQKPLSKGDTIEMNLQFEDGSQYVVRALVKDPDDALMAPESHE